MSRPDCKTDGLCRSASICFLDGCQAEKSPAAPSGSDGEDATLVALLDGYARDGTLGYQHYVERIKAWADSRAARTPASVGSIREEKEFDTLMHNYRRFERQLDYDALASYIDARASQTNGGGK